MLNVDIVRGWYADEALLPALTATPAASFPLSFRLSFGVSLGLSLDSQTHPPGPEGPGQAC